MKTMTMMMTILKRLRMIAMKKERARAKGLQKILEHLKRALVLAVVAVVVVVAAAAAAAAMVTTSEAVEVHSIFQHLCQTTRMVQMRRFNLVVLNTAVNT